ncbi:MAG: hypothetical protein ACK2UW_14095 [Anaerolineales bacterium]|jgi:hypothetical protein
MGFFKSLSNLFGAKGKSAGNVYWVYARCSRCGEVLRGRVNLHNDLSVEYGDKETQNTYVCRKILSGDGSNLCFQKVEILLHFDAKRKLLDREISGGTFIEAEEYQAAQETTA